VEVGADEQSAQQQPGPSQRPAAVDATQRFQRALTETRHADNWLEAQLQLPTRHGEPLRISTATFACCSRTHDTPTWDWADKPLMLPAW
jgi:hypothetical protein